MPTLASVGLTEAAARAEGIPLVVHTNDMSGWFSASTYAETAAWSKVLVHAKSPSGKFGVRNMVVAW
ncbi:MAG: hypothetical protein EXQ94_05475 [Alphaproteobacteria bacterium]|nr:hypothetical protein [Alphaproteobacteria bacterium]